MFIKIKNLINYILFLILSPFIRNKSNMSQTGNLLIIRLDAIGDYILFRNFLAVIKNDERYRQNKITLCGNILWKELAEILDAGYVDKFIWLDRKKFYGNLFYKFRLLRDIYNRHFETVINPTYTREILYGDEIVRASNAVRRIGNEGALDKHAKWKRKLFTDKYYTDLYPAGKGNLFEFYRNTEFFEHFLGKKIQLSKPQINSEVLELPFKLPEKYVVVFPGAKDSERRWSAAKFSEVSAFVIKEFDTKIIIAGSDWEKTIASEIISALNNDTAEDMTGRTGLAGLVKIIANAELLISNETGAVHIAAAVNTPFVCISNGNHLGRFHPYPEDIFSGAYYVYADEMERKLKENPGYAEELRFGSGLNINNITAAKVIKKVREILSDFNNN